MHKWTRLECQEVVLQLGRSLITIVNNYIDEIGKLQGNPSVDCSSLALIRLLIVSLIWILIFYEL